MISEQTRIRFGIGLVLLCAVLCFTSTVSGVFGLSQYRPVGYLAGVWYWFDRATGNITEPITHYFLRAILYLSVPVYWVGMIASLLVLLALACVLAIPYLLVALCVSIASISYVGALIVFIVIAILLSALVRKYWQAIAEAIAWVVVLMQGLLRLIVAADEQPQQEAAAAAAATAVPATIDWGRTVMANKPEEKHSRNVVEELLKQLGINKNRTTSSAAPVTNTSPVITAPKNIFESLTTSIRAGQAARAYDKQTEMVRSANNLESTLQTNYDLETKKELQPFKRGKETFEAHTDVLNAAGDYVDAQARFNAATASPNPITREFQQEFLPKEEGKYRADLYARQQRARAIKDALNAMTAELKEIDEGVGSEEDKNLAKQAIRAQYAPLLNPDAQTNGPATRPADEKNTRE